MNTLQSFYCKHRGPFLVLQFLSLFAFAFSVLYFRNYDAFVNPILYTEDGDWIGLALSKGWFTAVFDARPDYLVLGNLIFMWLSVQTSALLFGDALSTLPLTVATYSLIFFSLVALLGFYCTRSILSTWTRLFLYLLILLLPLGDSSSEILGRLSNIGYAFVLVSIFLLVERDTNCYSKNKKMALDILLFVCVATNPICFFVVLAYLFLELIELDFNVPKLVSRNKVIVCLFFVYFIFLYYRFSVSGLLDSRGKYEVPFVFDHLLEAVAARAILYPLIFVLYSQLNDFLTVTALILFFLYVFFAARVSASSSKRKIITLVAFCLVVSSLVTIFMRPMLTDILTGYDSTYADRYYYGINLLTIFLFVLAIDSFYEVRKLFCLAFLPAVVLILIYFSQFSFLFEGGGARQSLKTDLTFFEQLSSATNSSSPKFIREFSYELPFDSKATRAIAGPILPGVEYEQRIPMLTDNVTEISFQVATYARVNSSNLRIQLYDPSGNEIYNRIIDASKITDYGYVPILFDQVINFKNKDLLLKVSSLNSNLSNSITLLTIPSKDVFVPLLLESYGDERFMPAELLAQIKSNSYDLVKNGYKQEGFILSYKVKTVANKSEFLADSIIQIPIYVRNWHLHVPFSVIKPSNLAEARKMTITSGEKIKVLSELVGMGRYSGSGTTLAGEFIQGQLYSQRIPVAFNQLSGVALQLGTYARKNTGVMIAEIRDDQGRYVHKESIQLANIADSEYLFFRFAYNWSAMKGRDVIVNLSFPDSTAKNAVTVLLTKNISDQKYDAMINDESVLGYSLAYRIFVD